MKFYRVITEGQTDIETAEAIVNVPDEARGALMVYLAKSIALRVAEAALGLGSCRDSAVAECEELDYALSLRWDDVRLADVMARKQFQIVR